MTTEEMARSLVLRGLASPQVLENPRGIRTQDHRQDGAADRSGYAGAQRAFAVVLAVHNQPRENGTGA
jgi:hypothetical protein